MNNTRIHEYAEGLGIRGRALENRPRIIHEYTNGGSETRNSCIHVFHSWMDTKKPSMNNTRIGEWERTWDEIVVIRDLPLLASTSLFGDMEE